MANATNSKSYSYVLVYDDGKTLSYTDDNFKLETERYEKSSYHNMNLFSTLKKMGFNKEQILSYLFPEALLVYNAASNELGTTDNHDRVEVIPNSCSLKFLDGEDGKYINKQKYLSDVFSEIEKGNTKIMVNLEIKHYNNFTNASELFVERASFKTNYGSSSEARKNNIKTAMKAFDGKVLKVGEEFSFNETTGKRSAENGYKEAKIIVGGVYVEGFGGGVCQVSTTLYNACLLAGLEIKEVHGHSLPVSYVEPCFDAMVTEGSSDLIVRNNSGGKLIITTYCDGEICMVKIFGLANPNKIVRKSEILMPIEAKDDIITEGYQELCKGELQVGEERRIYYPKDGYIARGFISYLDEDGNEIQTNQIRQNWYQATNGLVAKRLS